MKQYRDYKEINAQLLRDPDDARLYLETALEEYASDQDIDALLVAIKDIVDSQGGITTLATKTGLPGRDLSDVLDRKTTANFESIEAILKGLGFRLAVLPIQVAS